MLPDYEMSNKKNNEREPKYVKKKISCCLKCEKKYMKKTEGAALKNKIGKQKSTCVVYDSKKPTFSKPIKPIKSKK